MYEIKDETIRNAFKPFDVVEDKLSGAVGFIHETNVNTSQSHSENQISYSVTWMTKSQPKVAWWEHDELEYHSNLFILIAEQMTHPHGNSAKWVSRLLKLKEGD